MKLLLENGADPRTEDSEGTTAFELAKNAEVRSLLHDAVIEMDHKKEISGRSFGMLFSEQFELVCHYQTVKDTLTNSYPKK